MNNSFREISACRICGNRALEAIISLGEQTLTGVFPKTRDEVITKGPLDLVRCVGDDACGLVQLRHSYNQTEMYGDNYGYRSGLNASMVRHLSEKVARLVARYAPAEGSVVLDIGSNDGTLLSRYSPSLVRVGMDPTARNFSEFYPAEAVVVPDFFSASNFRSAMGERKAAIVTSIAMFYDLEQPMEFVRDVASILAPEGVWHFEQSYLPLMLQACAYDTICHEHLEYYALSQIAWMVRRCGLKVVDVESNNINGGSFAVTVAREESTVPINESAVSGMLAKEKILQSATPFQEFARKVVLHREELLGTLEKLRKDGLSILGYGASTKGNVILQYCGLSEREIPAIAEVNPEKFGRYTPGTRIPIISEAEAHAHKPDCFLVMPWHFRDNLLEREVSFLQKGGKMLFPLPEIQLIGGPTVSRA